VVINTALHLSLLTRSGRATARV